jgi:hypothetical protein
MISPRNVLAASVLVTLLYLSCSSSGSGSPVEISPHVTGGPNPLCGIVLWQTNPSINEYADAVQLEFSYFYYSDVARDNPSGGYSYDWTVIDAFLRDARDRSHHGIIRFRDTDPELGVTRRSLPESLG